MPTNNRPIDPHCPILKQLHETYVDAKGAAQIMGYTARWLRQRRALGLPPHAAVMIGCKLFYRRSELGTFKKENSL